MSLGRIDHVYYWTQDMDRAVKFYQEVLGLELLRRDGSNWAMFDAGPVRLALHGAIEGRPIETGGATAVFAVDDLDASRAAFAACHASSLPVSWARRTNFVIPAPTTATLWPTTGPPPSTR